MVVDFARPKWIRAAWKLVFVISQAAILLNGRPAAAQTQNVTVVGQLGGTCLAITGQSNTVYYGEGLSLAVLNISNPGKPLRVGQLRLKGLVEYLALSGTIVYAAIGNELEIIDVSSPGAPALKGYYDMEGEKITALGVAGTTVYLGGSASFQVIDAANPVAPRLLGSLPISTDALALAGSLVCLGDADYGAFRIIDVSNPSLPRVRGSIIELYASKIVVSGNTAILSSIDALRAVDFSNPDAPALESGWLVFNFIDDLAVAGQNVLLLDDTGLEVVSVANPAAFQVVGSLALTHALTLGIAGSRALVFSQTGDLRIVEISNPAKPSTSGTYISVGSADGLAVAQGHAYVTGYGNGMRIIDVGNPAHPSLSGILPGLSGNPTIAGHIAYVASGRSLVVADVSNPAAPQVKGTYAAPEEAWAVRVAGNLAYVTYGFDQSACGMDVVDVSNPAAPKRVGRYLKNPSERWAIDLILGGKVAYLSEHWGGITAMDISNPAAPAPEGHFQNPIDFFYYDGLALKGNWLYAPYYWARGQYGVDVFNISDPRNPKLAGSFDQFYLPGNGLKLAISGDTLYEALNAGGLGIFDLSVPQRPVLTGGYLTAAATMDVVTTNGLITITDSNLGLVVLQPMPAAAIKVTTYSLGSLGMGLGEIGIDRVGAGRELYSDRGITLQNPVPAGLAGQIMLQLPDDDRDTTLSTFLKFEIDRAAEIDVAVDARMATVPGWLQGWTRLSETLAASDGVSAKRTLYGKVFSKGIVSLGPNRTQAMGRGYRMYSVIVRPEKNAAREWAYYY